MSRPLYARWMAQYAALRAAVLRATVSNSTAAQLTSHIVQLGVHARRNSLLLPVCRAIVPENGILQQSNNRQPVPEKNEGCRVADAEDEIEGVSPLDRLFAHPQAYQDGGSPGPPRGRSFRSDTWLVQRVLSRSPTQTELSSARKGHASAWPLLGRPPDRTVARTLVNGEPVSDLTFKATLPQKALAFGSRPPP